MLFNSPEFLLIYLPFVFGIFVVLQRYSRRFTIGWLLVASLVFYAWWNPHYSLLLISSILVNYVFARVLWRQRKIFVLAAGITFNLSVICYYKYTGFIINIFDDNSAGSFTFLDIILPLGISFFTFQQISFLVDVYKTRQPRCAPHEYALFVAFFPQLIAGPILRSHQILSQYEMDERLTYRPSNVAIGWTIFCIGLFKKTVIADYFAPCSDHVFEGAANGASISFLEAWGGTLSYSFQLYFDFSGYSDMAVGLARMFGIFLPANFLSPYRSTSIIDFWSKWHITLSKFLRDYLYIPLGGNQKGEFRRTVNVMTVMMLGGLWHGAGWTFIAWGGIHGFGIMINHIWRLVRKNQYTSDTGSWGLISLKWFATFSFVATSWVVFRASTPEAAFEIYSGLIGLNGIVLPDSYESRLEFLKGLPFVSFAYAGDDYLFYGKSQVAAILMSLLIVLYLPNAYEWLHKYRPSFYYEVFAANKIFAFWHWRPTPVYWFATLILFLLSCRSVFTKTQIFLYFQF